VREHINTRSPTERNEQCLEAGNLEKGGVGNASRMGWVGICEGVWRMLGNGVAGNLQCSVLHAGGKVQAGRTPALHTSADGSGSHRQTMKP